MKELIELFFIFAKIGSFTFGGGYAMLPMIQRELVDKRGYLTEQEIIDYFAIGQLTPGVIAVNVATFVGMKKKGMLGAVFTTLGVVFPSLVIITAIALVLNSFSSNPYVQYAFSGIRVAVIALIIKTVVKVIKNGIVDAFTCILFVISLILPVFFNLSSVFVVIISAAFAIAFKFFADKRGTK